MVHAPMRTLCAIIIITVIVGVGCTPKEIHWYTKVATPEQRAIVDPHIPRIIAERRAQATDCYGQMRQVFPASKWSWAEGIIYRESRGRHDAANPRSTARGCFQLLSSLHADKYTAVGCHVSQWANARCNVRAAHHLYLLAGTSPWNL